MVSVDPAAPHNSPACDARAVASGWLSLLLALEVTPQGELPRIEADLRALIRQMSMENPLWGAPRIHGELLKLGFEVAQSSVWSGDAGLQVRDGARFCVTTRQTLPPWTFHWTKMRRSLAQFSGSEASNHNPSLADFITTMSGFRFSVHTGLKTGPFPSDYNRNSD